jgi:hypothetical protein
VEICLGGRCVRSNRDAGTTPRDGGARDGGTAQDGGAQDGGTASVVPVGAACTGDGDCLGGLCVTDFPGGYCVQLDCGNPATPCPQGSTCFNVGTDLTACFKDCQDPSECRTSEGYTCDQDNTCYPLPDDGGTAPPDAGAPDAGTRPDAGTTGRPVGDPCTAGSQCADGACLNLPGGYCTMLACSQTSSCPMGSRCFLIGDTQTACFKTCQSEVECRQQEGYTCDADNTCYPAEVAPDGGTTGPCSPTNPTGTCPEGQVCNNGTCAPFTCSDTRFEPNETQTQAATAPSGTTTGLALCTQDKDWFKVAVPAAKILTLGATFQNTSGDLDLAAYNAGGQCLGGRFEQFCSWNTRDYETGEEFLSVLNGAASGDKVYAWRLQGYNGATNLYSLVTQTIPWQDGRDCTEIDPNTPCIGRTSTGQIRLVQFPFADPNDPYVGDGYRFDSNSNYRWARREMVQLVRYAIRETQQKFPNTKPLGLIDICQRDGLTPGWDFRCSTDRTTNCCSCSAAPGGGDCMEQQGCLRHPASTHDQGGNIDIAYYTTLASNGTLSYNEARIICDANQGSNDGAFCTSAATTNHVVDLPRQVYFMAKLFESSRLRVIGADQVIAPLLQQEAARQASLGWISTTLRDRFTSKMAYGQGWPYHHHHIHVSLQWWTSGKPGESSVEPAGSTGCGFDLTRYRARKEVGVSVLP